MTLGELFAEHGSLAKISQLGWFGMLTNKIPSQFTELWIVLIVVYDGSWMNMMSKFWLTSRMVLMRKLFFHTFWENIFRSFKIILWSCLQLNELSSFSCSEFLHIPLCTILYWSNVFKRDSCMSQLGIHLCSWGIWMCEGRVHPSLSLT